MNIIDRLNGVSDKLSSIQSNGINVTDEHINAVDEAIEEIERLREALEFYADPVTYEPVPAYINGKKTECYPIDGDGGEIARQALQGGKIK